MSLDERYRFDDKTIANAPRKNGVYILYDGDEIIYIGKADGQNTITSRLQAHKRGDEGLCTQQATSYSREENAKPEKREENLLLAYNLTHGKLPRCNKRIG